MEQIEGTNRRALDRAGLIARAAPYPYVWLDLGTGDGRYVTHLAAALPRWLVVGVDACREPLRERSRAVAPNALFVVANALALPGELDGVAQRVSINFPWGSLLEGLVEGGPGLLEGLSRVARLDALLEVRLNGGAVAELGFGLEECLGRVQQVLAAAGWRCGPEMYLSGRQLRSLPTTWARRLAHGPHPWALALRAVRAERSAAVTPLTTNWATAR
jgi:16S rRNA (adenine(1408)-N(1))-methyltransferase